MRQEGGLLLHRIINKHKPEGVICREIILRRTAAHTTIRISRNLPGAPVVRSHGRVWWAGTIKMSVGAGRARVGRPEGDVDKSLEWARTRFEEACLVALMERARECAERVKV